MPKNSSTMTHKLKCFFGWPVFLAPPEYPHTPSATKDFSRIAQDMQKVMQDFQNVLDREAAQEPSKQA